MLLLIVGFVGITKFAGGGHVQPVLCDKDKQVTANTVVMLSASWCGYCTQARKLFVDRDDLMVGENVDLTQFGVGAEEFNLAAEK